MEGGKLGFHRNLVMLVTNVLNIVVQDNERD